MTVTRKDVGKLVRAIFDENPVWNTIRRTLIGTGIAAGFILTGGLLLGPLGLAIGGLVGSTVAYYTQAGKFDSLVVAVQKLPKAKKEELRRIIKEMYKNFDMGDLITLLVKCENQRKNFVDMVSSFTEETDGASPGSTKSEINNDNQ
uniref:Putative membrane protein n=1 Tax=Ornithodoros turicata TaxID=34597 RepID=A0A2R5L4E8_9ACAR